ncbi:MAG TPA: Maf family protein [Pseudogracilibacillus sp.]|nr:Maf family protein [Pseudogracilibacillus sp.]
MKKLILASKSPRRQALLEQLHIPFTVKTGFVDESIIKEQDPIEKVKQLAFIKGRAIDIQPDEIVLAADTVVSLNNIIFEKPKDKQAAREMIRSLSDTTHHVYTGVSIRSAEDEYVFVEKTAVSFWKLSDEEIEQYIETKDPYDKAGAYGIQSLGAAFVKEIQGDYYNVVGLPLSRTVRALKKFGFKHYY